jgi:hypothetical protein
MIFHSSDETFFLNNREEIEGKISLSYGASQPPRLVQAMQGKEVDDAIQAERERDIKKINEDLILVKEMFRYYLLI